MLEEMILSLFAAIILAILVIIAISWDSLNSFFHKRYTFFNIFFIALYFLEQAIFIATSYLYPNASNLLVGFFALIVLSTVALQGIMMESKKRCATTL